MTLYGDSQLVVNQLLGGDEDMPRMRIHEEEAEHSPKGDRAYQRSRRRIERRRFI